MSITVQLPGSTVGNNRFFPERSLQTYVGENKAAKIGDIAEGDLSFEVRWKQQSKLE